MWNSLCTLTPVQRLLVGLSVAVALLVLAGLLGALDASRTASEAVYVVLLVFIGAVYLARRRDSRR